MFLFFLLLALAGNRCFGLDATFSEAHACVPTGHSSQQCEIIRGDTLSGISAAVYGHGNLYKTVLMGANPSIVDADKIYAGRTIIIPDAPSNPSIVAAPAASRVQSRAVAASAAAPLMNLLQIHPTIATESTPEFTAEIPMEDANVTLPAILQSMTPESVPKVAPATTANVAVEPAPAPTPTSVEKVRVSSIKITGYKLPIPKKVAADAGIPLGVFLTTHYNLYRSETAKADGRPIQYVRLKKKSWARLEGDNVVLYVPLTNLRSQPFTLLIDGINDPIDGRLFVANAQPLQGKLPGPRNGVHTLFYAIACGGSGYTLAAAFGPIAGPSVVVGALATRAILRHHANAMVENAEKEYNAALTKGNTPSIKEGQ
jgi:phage tail protein X